MRGLLIARIRGIPIRLHWSLLVALPLLAIIFGGQLVLVARLAELPPDRISRVPVLWGLGVAVALFLSVLVHELAHSLYALRKGGRVRGITLLILGGVSQISRPPAGAGREAVMALVGPLSSLALGAACYGLHAVAASAGMFNASLALFFVGYLNLALGIFNLLPAFPMDGGRILRAALIPSQGRLRATRIASWIGRAAAVALAIVGLVFGSLWLVFIAFFVYAGAESEFRSMAVEEMLGRVPVRQVMSPAPPALGAAETVASAAERMTRERLLALPVADDGRIRGVLTLGDVQRVERSRREATRVSDVVHAAPTVAPEDLTGPALELMTDAGGSQLPVCEDGRLVGMLTRDDVARAVQLRRLAAAKEGRRWFRRRESSA